MEKGGESDLYCVRLLHAGLAVDSAKSPLRSWCSSLSLARSDPALECSLSASQSAGRAGPALLALDDPRAPHTLYDLQIASASCIKMMKCFGLVQRGVSVFPADSSSRGSPDRFGCLCRKHGICRECGLGGTEAVTRQKLAQTGSELLKILSSLVCLIDVHHFVYDIYVE